MFTKLRKVDPKDCSVSPSFEKKFTIFILFPQLTYKF